jgi:hypothetical protein
MTANLAHKFTPVEQRNVLEVCCLDAGCSRCLCSLPFRSYHSPKQAAVIWAGLGWHVSVWPQPDWLLLEKLIVAWLFKEFHVIYRTRRFITVRFQYLTATKMAVIARMVEAVWTFVTSVNFYLNAEDNPLISLPCSIIFRTMWIRFTPSLRNIHLCTYHSFTPWLLKWVVSYF